MQGVFDFTVIISTHATHKGGDAVIYAAVPFMVQFQLTPPIRAATMVDKYQLGKFKLISTHATHKGGDDLTF